ncbi:NAD(P)/FAD-dependent oxidoreductase [Streptomyces fuscigenes]|uniref:NAD(P)/FAD-dependent oxidoreductase n=1 Tax=Streptomyces fuscigenes TaxID=1528880 RepID=UPI001F46FCAA|nr:FAD-dependent oxidoreductase [Streptomyces fuscigenes]MCF3960555.1 FAD-dependent oxidoreductase [Streptomyces fuscigenes]
MSGAARKTAVVGSGVAGLTAAYILRRGGHAVTLYEADHRLGGHAHTHAVPSADGRIHHVDSGFIVHNARTYPYLLRLFGELGVGTQESEMSMSVRCEGCGLEYAGARGLRGVLAQPRNALKPAYLRMLSEIPRFHRAARRLLRNEAEQSHQGGRPTRPRSDGASRAVTLGAFLDAAGFTPYFVAHFITPLVSAVWSCDGRTALRYPASYLFRFLDHHGLLSVGGSPTWRTVSGGSRAYVERIAKQLGNVHTSSPVRALTRGSEGATVTSDDGRAEPYDGVVIAVHPGDALRMLTDATDAERQTLGAFRYARNPAQLHTDTSLLPGAEGAAASWNMLLPGCSADASAVRISYDMNRLQRLDSPEHYVVTLNGGHLVDEGQVVAAMDYEHPVYTPESVEAQRHLPELNTGTTAYAGAYHGWGFHEDGCRSGVVAAASMGVAW